MRLFFLFKKSLLQLWLIVIGNGSWKILKGCFLWSKLFHKLPVLQKFFVEECVSCFLNGFVFSLVLCIQNSETDCVCVFLTLFCHKNKHICGFEELSICIIEYLNMQSRKKKKEGQIRIPVYTWRECILIGRPLQKLQDSYNNKKERERERTILCVPLCCVVAIPYRNRLLTENTMWIAVLEKIPKAFCCLGDICISGF